MGREQTLRGTTLRSRRAVASAFAALPLFVLVGLLAPNVVQVMAQVQEEPEEPVELDFSQMNTLERQPMLPFPRNFRAGMLPELSNLFGTSLYSTALGMQLSGSDSIFPSDHGDSLVIDDVDRQLAEILFRDPVIDGTVVALSNFAAPSPSLLPTGYPLGDGLIYDGAIAAFSDELNPNSVIPEPGTGLLFGLGLALLGARRLRSPRA